MGRPACLSGSCLATKRVHGNSQSHPLPRDSWRTNGRTSDWIDAGSGRRRLDFRTGGKPQAQAVERGSHQDLAGKARGARPRKGLVEAIDFLRLRGFETLDPFLVDIDMTGGACAGAATLGFERHSPVADHIHDPPTLERLKRVLVAMMVHYMNLHVICSA